jgi:hypothetical protein
MDWLAGLAGGLGGGLDAYQWMQDLKLRRKAQEENSLWRQEEVERRKADDATRAQDRADLLEERSRAAEEGERQKRETGFYKNRLPTYDVGMDVAPEDLPAFQEFAPSLVGQETVSVTDDSPSRFPYLGTPDQRTQKEARAAIERDHPELVPFLRAQDAGLPAGALTAMVRGDSQEDLEYRRELSRERARQSAEDERSKRQHDSTKRNAEVWKGNELGALEEALRKPQRDADNKPIPGTYGVSPEQLEAEKLRIENSYRAQIGLPPLTRLGPEWTPGAPAAPPLPVTQSPLPPARPAGGPPAPLPFPLAVAHAKPANKKRDPLGIR